MIRIALLVSLLGVAAHASAANFCVSTSAEFQAAFATAKANGESNTIRLRKGTYTTPAGGLGSTQIFDYAAPGTLSIEGGWSQVAATPCAAQSTDPASTVIDGMQTNRGLHISIAGGNDNLAVSVSNLTFQGGRSLASITNDRGAGLEAQGSASYVGSILVERCIFRDNAALLLGGGLYLATEGAAIVRNNLFTGNTAPTAAAVYVLSNVGVVGVLNNTLTGNTATTVGAQTAAMANDGDGLRVIINNIIWHNTTAAQTDVRGTEGIYYRNLIETLIGSPQAGSADNIVTDPLFVGATDFRLAFSSPAVDYGDSNPYGGVSALDLAGQPRVSGSAIDLGAYEAYSDRLFRDGFE